MRLLRIAYFDFNAFKGLNWNVIHAPQHPLEYTQHIEDLFLKEQLMANRVEFNEFYPELEAVLYDAKRISAQELDALKSFDLGLLSYQEADLTTNSSKKLERLDKEHRQKFLKDQLERSAKVFGGNLRYKSRGMKAMRKTPLTQEQVNYLNKLFGCDKRTAKFDGLRVSIITRRRQAADLDLEKVAARLTAKSVSVNQRDADVYLVDNALSAALGASPDFPGARVNLEEFEDLVFGAD